MAGMGYSLETHSGTSAAATTNAASNNSGFAVNFGGQQSATSGAAIPPWVYVAAAIGAALWLYKRKS